MLARSLVPFMIKLLMSAACIALQEMQTWTAVLSSAPNHPAHPLTNNCIFASNSENQLLAHGDVMQPVDLKAWFIAHHKWGGESI